MKSEVATKRTCSGEVRSGNKRTVVVESEMAARER